jgi:hypothetical protein
MEELLHALHLPLASGPVHLGILSLEEPVVLVVGPAAVVPALDLGRDEEAKLIARVRDAAPAPDEEVVVGGLVVPLAVVDAVDGRAVRQRLRAGVTHIAHRDRSRSTGPVSLRPSV